MEMQYSGKRQEFTTGAIRDTADDKPRLDLISPIMQDRLGHWLRIGADKYIPEEISLSVSSLT